MRYHTSYTRVLNMITAPEIPRLKNGGVALCHFCQREVYWAKGFLRLLAQNVEWLARYGHTKTSYIAGGRYGD